MSILVFILIFYNGKLLIKNIFDTKLKLMPDISFS